MKRSDFIRMTGLSMLANKKLDNLTTVRPVVLSTWNSGMEVNREAWEVLAHGGKALDAIEIGANYIENTINCCVGLGGYPDRDGIVTLDASIMDGNGNCGSVAALQQIKNPISVARKVMETTHHVLLVGEGAQQFALANGFKLEKNELSPSAKRAYESWLLKSKYEPARSIFSEGLENHDTMGLVALDQSGELAGGVTTSGLAFKMHDRVGDSPIIGAGLFVSNEAGAATSSGVGEEVIRICGTHLVVELMRQGHTPENACKKAVERIVKRDPEKARSFQVGFLALNAKGQIGAYAVQNGFQYSVKTETINQVFDSKFMIRKASR